MMAALVRMACQLLQQCAILLLVPIQNAAGSSVLDIARLTLYICRIMG